MGLDPCKTLLGALDKHAEILSVPAVLRMQESASNPELPPPLNRKRRFYLQDWTATQQKTT